MDVPEGPSEGGTEYKHGQLCMYIQSNAAEIQTPTYSESDRPQHGYPATCVIAQQYSPITFVQWRFHSCKEKFGARFRNVINPIL